MEVKEKILFWNKGAKRALAVAEDLLRLKRYVEALFFGHLALEKALKAKIVIRLLNRLPRKLRPFQSQKENSKREPTPLLKKL